MTKTQKKLEQAIIQQLTLVCEIALVEIEGFCWLTHEVNYNQFPKSLRVICMFDNHLHSLSIQSQKRLRELCVLFLKEKDITLQSKQVEFSVDSKSKI